MHDAHFLRRPRRTVLLLAGLGLAVLTACGEDPVGTTPDPDPFTGDTLAAPASTLASEAMERIEYEPRAEDFAPGHPDLSDLLVSFNTAAVVVAPNTTVGALNALLKSLNADLVGSIPGVPDEAPSILFLRIPSESHAEMESALTILRDNPAVQAAVQDAEVTPSIVTDPTNAASNWIWDGTLKGNWGMLRVRAPQLWNFNEAIRAGLAQGTTQSRRLAVIDAGFATSHPDLSLASLSPSVQHYHGVAVAGVAGANWNNKIGVDGIDPNVALFGLAETGDVNTWAGRLVDQLNTLVQTTSPTVVNLSMGFGWSERTPPVDLTTNSTQQAFVSTTGQVVLQGLLNLQANGFELPVITAAAGNDSDTSPLPIQPARYASPLNNAALEHGAQNIIVVEATDVVDSRASFSNDGGHVSAPGVDILSTSINHVHDDGSSHNGDYYPHSGTSFAAPLVGGLVTYLYALAGDLPEPTLADNPVLDILKTTGRNVSGGGAKQIDAFAAALELDVVRRDDRVLTMLLDVDDGSPDGNLRINPWTGADEVRDDFDNNNLPGDGVIDMSDFRVWRDAHVMKAGFGSRLDGSAQHAKKDFNGNGTVEGPQEEQFARVDFNGDGFINPIADTHVGGSIGATATDLDVLGKLFDDPHYEVADLPDLELSGDISIDPDYLLLRKSSGWSIRSYVHRASDELLLDSRVHSGASEEEAEHQIYTLNGIGPDNDYVMRVDVYDTDQRLIFTQDSTVTLEPGMDIYWDPDCPLDEDGVETGSTAQGPLCVQVEVSPGVSFILGGQTVDLKATVEGALDTSVTWSLAGPGTVSEEGLYSAPGLTPGQSVLAKVIAKSNADDLVADTALVVVSQPRITDPDPEASCTPTDRDDCSRDGRSWGDPHLITPDGTHYDFHASGDFILARSTDPTDDFEIQARYTQPTLDREFSWNHAAAMRVQGHVVEVYAGGALDIPEVRVDGEPRIMRENGIDNFYDLDGGSVSLLGDSVAVSWPDRTLVLVKPSHVEGVLSEIRVSIPYSRNGSLEGLLGDFDGDAANDVRVRGGVVLNPEVDGLYTDYRQGWWIPVGSAESMFGQGIEHFDGSFPPGSVTVDDLDVDDATYASEVCRNAGVLDPDIMEACIIDVVLTGDDDWALVAAGVDPNTLGILVSPSAFFLAPGDSQEFGAIVTGTADRRVEWTATGGTIVPTGDNIMTYTAPEERGEYTVTATLVADGSLVSTATVHVIGAPTGYSKQWNGSVSGDWFTAENWTPVGVPDSTDNVYIPTWDPDLTPYNVSWGNNIVVVNDILVEADTYASGTVRVHGNADITDSSRGLWVEMRGANRTVRGSVETLQVFGTVRAGGPLQATTLHLESGGSFSPGGETVTVTSGMGSRGRLVMTDPNGHLVAASLSFTGSSPAGSLTAGTLEVAGSMDVSRGTFVASQDHRVVFSGTAQQSFSASKPNFGQIPSHQILNHVEFANPAGVVLGVSKFRIDGLVEVTGGTVTGQSQSIIHLSQGLVDPAGGWNVPVAVTSQAVLLPAVLNADLQVGTGPALQTTLLDDLEVNGKLRVERDARLLLNDRTLVVNGNLETHVNGTIVMDSDEERLTVSGDAIFGINAPTLETAGALFSAGVFDLRGDLIERYLHFRPSGTHLTRFTGNAPQTAGSHCWYTNCGPTDGGLPPAYAAVEVTNPAGVTFQGRRIPISGLFTVAADAVATFDLVMDFAGSLDVAGSLTVTAGKTITVADTLFLRAASLLDNQGTMTVTTCETEDGHTVTGTNPCQ